MTYTATATASRSDDRQWTKTYTASLLQRIYSRCVSVGDCLVWTGYRNWGGYGYINDARTGQVRRVHRLAYEIEKGPIGEGLVIDHLCARRACVAVKHLEPVTQRENIRRAIIRRQQEEPKK